MATANTVSTLSGLFKEVYADQLESLVPAAAKLQKAFPFVSRDKQEGNQYHQPVRLTRCHGWTLSTSGDAFAMHQPEPARTQDAVISGSHFLLREAISYSAASKLLSGKGAERKRAFVQGTSYMIENMTETAAFVLELQLLYGQSDLGIIESRTSGSGTTSQVFVFTAATFIPAMWSGLENGYVEVWDTTGATQRNLSGTMQVTAVNTATRSVTFSGVAAEMDAIVATDKLYLRDTKSAGMVGVRSIAANSGTLFGINSATYSLWAGNTFATTGSLSFAKMLQALNLPINRGLMSDCEAYISPNTWTDCNNDLSALRRYADKAGGKIEQGSEDITYYSQVGTIKLIPHLFMKPSEAIVIPKGKFIRLGSSELTFTPPGADSESFFENLPDNAGYGTRCWWSQAVFSPNPNSCLVLTGIQNSDS